MVVDAKEVTELAGAQPQLRELVTAAFAERLPGVPVHCDFHRGWNGGWRVRATLEGRASLDFAILRVGDELVAWPVPFPAGWKVNGVRGSAGGRYGVSQEGEVIRLG
jgi:hypothetical protein